MKFAHEDVDYVIEIPGVYDGWSIAVLTDGTWWNRWGNDDDTGPAEGYERRWRLTQEYIDTRGDQQ